MKQTVEEAAINELFFSYACTPRTDVQHPSFDGLVYDKNAMLNMFKKGAEWQSKQSPWISVKERLPEDNENIIIMCEHGAIFNGVYCDGEWFCMDGYIHDLYKDSPIYSSMSCIPPLWKPVAWMRIPTFDQILEANKDVLQRLKEKGD